MYRVSVPFRECSQALDHSGSSRETSIQHPERQIWECFNMRTRHPAWPPSRILPYPVMDNINKVHHWRLICNLEFYRIYNKISKWIKSFPANRTHTVVLEDEVYNIANVPLKVQQGVVLGPCMILFYISDLPDNLKSKVRHFTNNIIVPSRCDAMTFPQGLEKGRCVGS